MTKELVYDLSTDAEVAEPVIVASTNPVPVTSEPQKEYFLRQTFTPAKFHAVTVLRMNLLNQNLR